MLCTVLKTNPPPGASASIFLFTSSDTSSGVGLKLKLKVKIVDEDSNSLDVTFFNAENNEKIGEDKKVISGKYASCELTLPFNTTYAWYAHVTDGLQENRSDPFFFTTMITPTDDDPPVADGGGPYTADPGDPIVFDASGSYDNDGTIDFYRWNFGDGTSELLEQKPTHTYQKEGVYTVTLTVIDNLGATDSITFSVPVGLNPNQPPTADPNGPYQAEIDEYIFFDGTNSTDSDGTITEYLWDFGDNTMTTGAEVTHKYNTSGSYLVKLKVTDNYGDSHIQSTTVTIQKAKEQENTPGFELILIIIGLISILIIKHNRRK